MIRFRSISSRITYYAMSITMAIVLIFGLVSFYFMRRNMIEQVNERAMFQARFFANNCEDILERILHDVRSISENLLVVNAMIDSMGREAYLTPYLRGFKLQRNIPFMLALYDFEGKPVSSNQDNPTKYGNNRNIAALMDEGRPLSYLHSFNGRTDLHMEYPVFYSATGLPEGFIVMEIGLDDIMALSMGHEPTEEMGHTMRLLSMGNKAWEAGAGGGEMFHKDLPLHLSPPLDTLALSIEYSESMASLNAPLFNLTMSYAAAGLLMLSMAYAASRVASQRISAPIMALSAKAKEIAETGRPLADITRLPAEEDEVGVLTRSFGFMLEELRRSHEGLEHKVQERTWALRQSEQYAKNILSSIKDTIITSDEDRVITGANQPALRETFGYETAEVIGRETSFLYASRENFEIAGREVFNARGDSVGKVLDLEFRRKSGETFPAEFHALKLMDEGGKPVGNMGVVRDITERKRAEDMIVESLREKEVLLKEIHHRVKNNMAIVSSLLNLQSRYFEDGEQRRAFRESQNRIMAMALVHEKLYRSVNFISIDVDDYIRSLVDNLKRALALDDGVNTSVEVEDVHLDIDTLIPCGLILNELLTNAFKYAPGSSEIRVSLRRFEEDGVAMAVSDSGTGLPEGFDVSGSQSLGFMLVRSLVSQIDGTLDIRSEGGLTVTVTFPCK